RAGGRPFARAARSWLGRHRGRGQGARLGGASVIETGSARDAQRVYAVVDSGTTTTRLRLWRGGAVTWSGSRAAGAKDTAVDGNTAKVEAALAELLEQCDIEPEAIVCSGMITSNMGLFELPHLPAPAGL